MAKRERVDHGQSVPCLTFDAQALMRKRLAIDLALAGRLVTPELRRNLGHIYALEHGATIVADAHAYHRLRGRTMFELPTPIIDSRSSTLNLLAWHRASQDHLLADVYGHFGWPGIHAKGTCPFTCDKRVLSYNSSQLAFLNKFPVLSIVQSLIDIDPDVDEECPAMINRQRYHDFFHTNPSSRRFCADVPAVQLEYGLFGPMNARNTIFYPLALPLLFLPWVDNDESAIGSAKQVPRSDLLRGWIAQRLLWDAGSQLIVQGSTSEADKDWAMANAVQPTQVVRSSLNATEYSFLPLLEYLRNWQSKQNMPRSEERQVELIDELVHDGYLNSVNRILVRIWVANHRSLRRLPFSVKQTVLQTHMNKSEESLASLLQARIEKCSWRRDWSPRLHPVFRDILVNVHFNRQHFEVVRSYLDLYAPAFPNIVFFGAPLGASFMPPYDVLSYIASESNNGDWGWYQHLAIAEATRRYPHFAGYLHTNDDVFLNYWKLARRNTTRAWYPNPHPRHHAQESYDAVRAQPVWPKQITRWKWTPNISNMQAALRLMPCWAVLGGHAYEGTLHLIEELHNECRNPFADVQSTTIPFGQGNSSATSQFLFYSGSGDFVYVPQTLAKMMSLLFQSAFSKLMMEISIPSALYFSCGNSSKMMVDRTNSVAWARGLSVETLLGDLTIETYHPVKLGLPAGLKVSQDILKRDSWPHD